MSTQQPTQPTAATTAHVSQKRTYGEISKTNDLPHSSDKVLKRHIDNFNISDAIVQAAKEMSANKQAVQEQFLKLLKTIPQHVVLYLLEWVQQAIDVKYEEGTNKPFGPIVGRFSADSSRTPVLIFKSLRLRFYDMFCDTKASKFFHFVMKRVKYLEFDTITETLNWYTYVEQQYKQRKLKLEYIDIEGIPAFHEDDESPDLVTLAQAIGDKIRTCTVPLHMDDNVITEPLSIPGLRNCSGHAFVYLDRATRQQVRKLFPFDLDEFGLDFTELEAALAEQPTENIVELVAMYNDEYATQGFCPNITKQLTRLQRYSGSFVPYNAKMLDALPVSIKSLPVYWQYDNLDENLIQRFTNLEYLHLYVMFDEGDESELDAFEQLIGHIVAKKITVDLRIVSAYRFDFADITKCIASLNRTKLLVCLQIYVCVVAKKCLTPQQIMDAAFDQGIVREVLLSMHELSFEDMYPLLSCPTLEILKCRCSLEQGTLKQAIRKHFPHLVVQSVL